MPSSKEDIALRWEMSSEEEKNEKRKRHAEAQKRYREKKGNKKTSEMSSQEVYWKRTLDRKNQQNRRTNMTKEEKDIIRAKDRARKGKKSQEQKVDSKEKTQSKQKKNNCTTQKKIRHELTEKDKERVNAQQAESMRLLRSNLTSQGKILSKMKARHGMRLCRKFGYLGEYKQRKKRDSYNAFRYSRWANKNGFSVHFPYDRRQRMKRKGEKRSFRKSDENMKQLNNRLRVKRHRQKIKKLLQKPVIIEENGLKSDYELLREKNMEELERLKKESGLFK